MDGLSLLENDLGLDLNLSLRTPKRRKRKLDDFTPEVEQSALKTLGGKALSGIAAVGNLLDVPGSMVRDVIGGENPFDQILSPLSDENRLSGRDIARQFGLMGRRDTTANWWGGLGAEILLDPTTYLTFGTSAALTGAGKVARAAGLLDDVVKATGAVGRRSGMLKGTLDDLIQAGGDDALERVTKAAEKQGLDLDAIRGERLGTLARLEVPFTDLGFNVGSGKTAQRLAEGIDVVGNLAKQTLPVRAARALFDPTVMGELDFAKQQVAEHAFGLRKEGERLARKEHVQALKDIDETYKVFNETYGDALRQDSEQAAQEFAGLLQTKGKLSNEQATAVAGVWRSWAEGYLGEDFGTALRKRFKGIDDSGNLPVDALQQSAAAPVFYSKLARVVEQKVGGKTSWDQLKATLKNQGVTDEEIVDMGLEGFFAGKKSVERDDLLEHLRENTIQLNEVTKAKFSDATIPGGDPNTYRELLLTTPRQATRNELFDQANSLMHDMHTKYGDGWRRKATADEVAKVDDLQRQAENLTQNPNYRGQHWEEPNVLAHIRMDDITAPDGRKFLRVQEIQSDWHQAGKKHGYFSGPEPEQMNFTEWLRRKGIELPFSEKEELFRSRTGLAADYFAEQDAALSEVIRRKNAVPDGPFKESWSKLAVKRVLRYAAENGYDGITLVEGKDIAEAVNGPPGPLSEFYDNILAGYVKKYAGKMGSETGVAVHKELGLRMKTYTLPEKMRTKLLAEGQPLYQRLGETAKGAVSFDRDGKALLYTFQATDVSTHVHELSHVMRRHLTPEDQSIASKFVGATDAKWTTAQEEKFARGFENYLRTGKAPSTAIGRLFDKLKEWMTGIYQAVTGSAIDVKLTPEIQQLYGRLIGSQPKQIQYAGQMTDLAKHKAVYDTFQKVIGLSAELGGDVDQAFKTILGRVPPPTPELSGKIKAIGDNLQKTMKDVHSRIIEKGGRTSFIADTQADDGIAAFEYMPRYVKPDVAKQNTLLKSNKVLQTKHGSMQARDEAIRTIPKEIVNKMLQDETLRGPDGVQELLAKHGDRLLDTFEGGREGHAQALQAWIERHRPAALFTMQTSDEYLRYMTGANVVDKTYDAIHDLVARNMAAPNPGSGNVPIHAAYQNAGLDADKAVQHLANLTGKSVDEVQFMGISADLANAIGGVHKVTSQPEWAKAIGDWVDKFNNWFKQEVTIPFPSFWTRNFVSGQYMNLASGLMQTPQDVAEYSKHVWRVKDMIQKGVPREMMDELIIEGVIDPRVVSEGVETVHGFSPTGPRSPLRVGETLAEAKQNVLENPLFTDKAPGAKAVRTGWATVKGTGEKASAVVEFANRVPLYLFLRERGWDAVAAANKVKELQIDYSALSPFEKNVMRRVAPFYSFNRRIAPVILSTLASRPGGALAQTIRASNEAKGEDSLSLPEYVANTLSIPLGVKPDGSLSYMTGFGLPHEQPLSFLEGGVQGVIREALSQTTPLVKAPIEWASGQSFFQRGPGGAGRPLDEMDPLVGRALSNALGQEEPVELPRGLEFLAANSPYSRIFSTARKAADPRKTAADKALNLLTGINQTDVSPATQDKVLREKASELMEEMGAYAFERVSFSKAEKAKMSPEQRQQAEALELLQAALADRAKQRKK